MKRVITKEAWEKGKIVGAAGQKTRS